MTKEQAIAEAKDVARTSGVSIAVTYCPYSEEEDDSERYSYHPEAACGIFKYEEVIEVFNPPLIKL